MPIREGIKAVAAGLNPMDIQRGVDGSVVVGKVSESASPGLGFDAHREVNRDMLEAGIIDSGKVWRIAFENAASIAGLLITTEAMVAEKPQKPGAGRGMAELDVMGVMM